MRVILDLRKYHVSCLSMLLGYAEIVMGNDHNHAAKYLNDVHSTDELLEMALSKDADHDDEGYWQPIRVLQHRLPTIFERIQILARDIQEKRRDTAATIFGQSRVKSKFAPETCTGILLTMLEAEKSNEVLSSIFFALGHLRTPNAIPSLVRFRSHSDSSVRYAVVSSLSKRNDNAAVEAMIELSADIDRDVRNWATFGLGSQIDVDTPAIREALFNRLDELDDEIRGEALVGLARRGDFRVTEAWLAELDRNNDNDIREWSLFMEAAEEIVEHASTTKWLSVLNKIAELKMVESSRIQMAVARCK